MSRRPDPDRALAQLDRHRSGNPNDPPPAAPSLANVGLTVAQHLRGAEAGMRLLAEIAPGWRLGS